MPNDMLISNSLRWVQNIGKKAESVKKSHSFLHIQLFGTYLKRFTLFRNRLYGLQPPPPPRTGRL